MMRTLSQGRARLVSDHLRFFPSMRSGVGDGMLEVNPNPTAAEVRLFTRVGGAVSLQESQPVAEMPALLTIGVCAKLRVRALDERWTRRFVFKFIRLLPRVAEATPVFQLGGMTASDSFLQPDRINYKT
jgi:hypothetical protein